MLSFLRQKVCYSNYSLVLFLHLLRRLNGLARQNLLKQRAVLVRQSPLKWTGSEKQLLALERLNFLRLIVCYSNYKPVLFLHLLRQLNVLVRQNPLKRKVSGILLQALERRSLLKQTKYEGDRRIDQYPHSVLRLQGHCTLYLLLLSADHTL